MTNGIDLGEIASFDKNVDNVVLNRKDYKGRINKEVYLFVSFDLLNSTKIKYLYPGWQSLITKLVSLSNSDWLGLNFWKFNGDELLFYAKISALNQLADVLNILHDKSNELNEKLKSLITVDESSGCTRDLIGIKTSIWIACVSKEEKALNSKLDSIDTIDFSGISMDEGFRMSKCVIQNKLIIDPKIVLLLCLANIKELKRSVLSGCCAKDINKQKNLNLDDKFRFFCHKSNSIQEIKLFYNIFSRLADGFRLIGYETCKGVWDERKYPMIWYSRDWKETEDKIKYDEEYLEKTVDKEFINSYYKTRKYTTETLNYLKKIYDNVSIFQKAVDEIMLESDLRLYTNAKLDIQIDSRTYIYYSIVCIKPDSKGVLTFLRSEQRGHLPNIWDFETQKNAQRTSGIEVISQIEDKFLNNFGVKIKIIKDENRESLIPMDIHPIYRRGKLHNGILCFAYIDEDNKFTEDEIIYKIKAKLSQVVSGSGYPFYSDVSFVHENQLKMNHQTNKVSISMDDKDVKELTYADIADDSTTWNNHNKSSFEEKKCIPNFALTIKDAIEYTYNYCNL